MRLNEVGRLRGWVSGPESLATILIAYRLQSAQFLERGDHTHDVFHGAKRQLPFSFRDAPPSILPYVNLMSLAPR